MYRYSKVYDEATHKIRKRIKYIYKNSNKHKKNASFYM